MTTVKTKRGPGRPPVIDATEVLAALQAGEAHKALAERLKVDLSTVYRAADRERLRLLLGAQSAAARALAPAATQL